MRMKERNKRDLKNVTGELIKEYNKALESKYVVKPMAYTLFMLWRKWDCMENPRSLKVSEEM